MGTLDLRALEIFRAVAREGGITKAAARLHRVQSNVTTRVKQLEAQLGTPLFVRRNRRLFLSPHGKRLLAYADRLLELSSEAEAAMHDDAPSGALALGALESTAATRLPPLLARYHRAYPNVRLDVVTGTTGALIGKILSHDLDAAFVAEPFVADGLDVEEAFREELVLITSRQERQIRRPRDVGHATLIAFATGCSYRRRLEAWLGSARLSPQRVIEFGSYHAIVACVAAGVGIAIVPRSVLRLSIGRCAVVTHRLPPAIATTRTCLVWPRGRRFAAVDALRSELKRRLEAPRSR